MSPATASASATRSRPRRADALRNRERVIEAAAEVFAAKGLDAGIPEIAAVAGVGKATVYRSFPSKEHLVAAVAVERLAWMTGRVTRALTEPDAGEAFEAVLVELAERQADDGAVVGSLAADIHLPELEAARAATQASFEALIDRARATGALRPDATADDLRVLFTGVSQVLRADGERDPATWRRYGRLVADALRA
ncbi:MAG TPA: helix-turn-helix domain-containing protein [Baekduia sp.]|uniref:TetR/AcrR family transcriptional regulator n=1 Tax=Baekduia sp. TaxID=2600305 RepID=UPI002D76D96E|nr:helix-turn-helix domain-containing protein [Baekduia sp.]HET6507441.1 helix-turn-helix domain-containing protein [Baekduia sp.]